MPLTSAEREFLDAYVYEVTNGPPFGGPATSDLGRRGIWYPDLSWILSAYQRELSAERIPATGHLNPNPPPSPWLNLEEVRLRNRVMEEELEFKATSQATHKFIKHVGGRSYYAKVTVEVGEQGSRQIMVDSGAFSWLKEVYGPDAWEWSCCMEWRKAAVAGARYGLERESKSVDVKVKTIRGMVADTTASAVAYAAYGATLEAIGRSSNLEPQVHDGKLIFLGVSE